MTIEKRQVSGIGEHTEEGGKEHRTKGLWVREAGLKPLEKLGTDGHMSQLPLTLRKSYRSKLF